MKLHHLISVFALAAFAPACVMGTGAEEIEKGTPGEEEVGTAEQALTQVDYMTAIPWGSQAGWANETIFHEVDNVFGKDVTLEIAAKFPQYTGAFTQAKYDECTSSYVIGELFQRNNSGQPWGSPIATYKYFATPTISWSPSGVEITACNAHGGVPDCDAIHFTQDQMLLETNAIGGGVMFSMFGPRTDVIRRPAINLANCD